MGKVFSFIGGKALFYISLAAFLGILLAITEVALAAFLVSLLSFLGLPKIEDGPFSSIMAWLTEQNFVFYGFVLLSLFRAILHVAKGYFAVSASELFVARMRYFFLRTSLEKSIPGTTRSTIYSTISETVLKSSLALLSVAHALPIFVQCILLLWYLFTLSGYLWAVSMVVISISGIVVFLVQRRISRSVYPLQDLNFRLFRDVKRILDNYLLIRIFSIEGHEIDRIRRLLGETFQRVRLGALFSLISENLPQVFGSFTVVFLLSIQVSSGDESSDIFVSFIYLLIRLLQNFSQLVSFLGGVIANFPYIKSCFNLYNFSSEFYKNTKIIPHDLTGSFTSHNLFDGKNTPGHDMVLEPPEVVFEDVTHENLSKFSSSSGLSTKIPAGRVGAVIGKSGSGKTTLLNILAGEADPSAGRITIGRYDPVDFLALFGSDVSYAGPEPFLFDGTLRENLLYGNRKEIHDAEIINLLHRLGMKYWLESFGSDLEAALGPGGIGVSTGQAQRLSLARAFLRKPRFLLLDEVTANLDGDAELLVCDILRDFRGACTIFMITHSVVVRDFADTVLNLDAFDSVCGE